MALSLRRDLATVLPVLVLTLQLAACGIDIDNDPEGSANVTASAATVLTGSVGDGPITGATLRIYDRDGRLIQTETSDNSASYAARIKAKGNAYPLTIEVTDGIDLVTGRAPDFKLRSVVMHPSTKNVNINPFTTLIVGSASAMPGGLTEANVAVAQRTVVQRLNFGLDPLVVNDPLALPISDGNVAVMIKASEALGEMIRRTGDGLRSAGVSATLDQVVAAIGADLVDGVMDGIGSGAADRRVAATATLVSAQVLIEALSNNLKVDGIVATGRLDDAARTTHPSVPENALTSSVRINGEMLEQARLAVAAARALVASSELASIADKLDQISPNSRAAQIEATLPGEVSGDLDPVIMLAASSSDEELAVVNDVVRLATGTGGSTPENRAPVIAGSPALAGAAGSPYLFVPSASDPDGDALVFSISNRPGWASFDTGSGRLSGTPTDADAGTYGNIIISVSDGSLTSSLPAFSVTVSANVPGNSAPSISGTPAASVAEDSTYVFLPSVSDPDGDSLSFIISNRPVWASFDSSTGRMSGTPGNSHVGTYSGITITVSDGASVASLGPFSVTVLNTNDAPDISGTPPASAEVGSGYSFRPVASDPDGDNLVFSIQNRPGWASFDTSTGRLSGTPTASDVGSYANIRISVSDGVVSAALASFTLTVNSAASQTGSVSLSWAAPTSRSDGTALALSEIAGYTLYYGSASGEYTNSIAINDPGTTSLTLDDLPVGTYYFVMTTRDTDGLESGYSAAAERQVQ